MSIPNSSVAGSVESHAGHVSGTPMEGIPSKSEAALYFSKEELEPIVARFGRVHKLFECDFRIQMFYGPDETQDAVTIYVDAPEVLTVTVHHADIATHFPKFAQDMHEGNIRVVPQRDVFDPNNDGPDRDFGCLPTWVYLITSGEFKGYSKRNPEASFMDYTQSAAGRLDFAMWTLLPNIAADVTKEDWVNKHPSSPYAAHAETIKDSLMSIIADKGVSSVATIDVEDFKGLWFPVDEYLSIFIDADGHFVVPRHEAAHALFVGVLDSSHYYVGNGEMLITGWAKVGGVRTDLAAKLQMFSNDSQKRCGLKVSPGNRSLQSSLFGLLSRQSTFDFTVQLTAANRLRTYRFTYDGMAKHGHITVEAKGQHLIVEG